MMRRALMGILIALAAPFAAASAGADGEQTAPDAVLEQVWSSASTLTPKLRARLAPQFMETAALTGDASIIKYWQRVTGAETPAAEIREDWGLSKARALVEAEGWETLISRARARTAPMNMGRPDIMAAAALHLADEAMAKRITAEMFTLAAQDRSEAGFERAAFGHSLAEIAATRCDLDMFDRATALAGGGDSLRYAFWRARMTGDVSAATSMIGQLHDGSSTTVLRQALDGYGMILERGLCPASVNTSAAIAAE